MRITVTSPCTVTCSVAVCSRLCFYDCHTAAELVEVEHLERFVPPAGQHCCAQLGDHRSHTCTRAGLRSAPSISGEDPSEPWPHVTGCTSPAHTCLPIATHALPERCLRYTFHIAAVFSRLYPSAMAAATPDGEAGVLRKRRSTATGPSALQPLQPKVEGNDVA